MLEEKFIIRDADHKDLDSIYNLALIFNTVNLPANKKDLESLINSSMSSFSLQETNPNKRSFLLVLEDANKNIIGTSQVFSKHGTLDSPHTYFSVNVEEKYSCTLHKYFKHIVLRLGQSFDGPSEVGSLVLHPSYRSHPYKLGKLLSFSRFLLIAMARNLFADKIIAELLPNMNANEEPYLWKAVGRKFTGLSYQEADHLSRVNKEFIVNLFPSSDIYVSLLDEQVLDILGKVGDKSYGAAHLLSSIGFNYTYKIDPFDGGPHYEAYTKNITIINNTKSLLINSKKLHQKNWHLIAKFAPFNKSSQRFYCSMLEAQTDDEFIYLEKNIIDYFGFSKEEKVYVCKI